MEDVERVIREDIAQCGLCHALHPHPAEQAREQNLHAGYHSSAKALYLMQENEGKDKPPGRLRMTAS